MQETDTEEIFGQTPDLQGDSIQAKTRKLMEIATMTLEEEDRAKAGELLAAFVLKPTFSESIKEFLNPIHQQLWEFFSEKLATNSERMKFLIMLLQTTNAFSQLQVDTQKSSVANQRSQDQAQRYLSRRINRLMDQSIQLFLFNSESIEKPGLQTTEELYLTVLTELLRGNKLCKKLISLKIWPSTVQTKYLALQQITDEKVLWDEKLPERVDVCLKALAAEIGIEKDKRLPMGPDLIIEEIAHNPKYIQFVINQLATSTYDQNFSQEQLVDHLLFLLRHIPEQSVKQIGETIGAIAIATREIPFAIIQRFGSNKDIVEAMCAKISGYLHYDQDDDSLHLFNWRMQGDSFDLQIGERDKHDLCGSVPMHDFMSNLLKIIKSHERPTEADWEIITRKPDLAFALSSRPEAKTKVSQPDWQLRPSAFAVLSGVGSGYLAETLKNKPDNPNEELHDKFIGEFLLNDRTEPGEYGLSQTERLTLLERFSKESALPKRFIPIEVEGLYGLETITPAVKKRIRSRCEASVDFEEQFITKLLNDPDELHFASFFTEGNSVDLVLLNIFCRQNQEFAKKICSLNSKNRILYLLASFSRTGIQSVSPSFDFINELWRQTSNSNQGDYEQEMSFVAKLFPEDNGFQLQQVILQNSNPLESFRKILFRLFQRLVDINPAAIDTVLFTSNELNKLVVGTLTSLEKDPEWTIPDDLRGLIGTQLLVNGVERLSRGQGQMLFGKNSATFQTAVAQRLNPIIEAGYYDLANKGSRNPEQIVKSYFDYLEAFGCLDQAGKVINPEMENTIETFCNHWLSTIDDYSKISTMFYGRGQFEIVDRLIGNYLLAHCNEFNDENEQNPTIYWEKFPHWMWEEEPFNQLRPETLRKIEQALRERNSDGACEKHLEMIGKLR